MFGHVVQVWRSGVAGCRYPYRNILVLAAQHDEAGSPGRYLSLEQARRFTENVSGKPKTGPAESVGREPHDGTSPATDGAATSHLARVLHLWMCPDTIISAKQSSRQRRTTRSSDPYRDKRRSPDASDNAPIAYLLGTGTSRADIWSRGWAVRGVFRLTWVSR